MMILGKSIFLFFVSTILQVQRCGSAKYCQEAVDSVKTVQSCPTSKTEWDAAARRKNCSSIASKQSCSLVDKFVYHCVINGYRNVTLEVCAPSRIIFGHCVEFNVAGGVIQDQFSARCNESFPKCDSHYLSSTAYKYPDCYKLVQGEYIYQSTTFRITTNDTSATIDLRKTESFHFLWLIFIIIIGVSVSFAVGLNRRRRRQTENSNSTGEKSKLLPRNNDIEEEKHEMSSNFQRCLSMGEFSTNISPYRIREHSDTFLIHSVKDFETRRRRYGHKRNCTALF